MALAIDGRLVGQFVKGEEGEERARGGGDSRGEKEHVCEWWWWWGGLGMRC